MFDKRRYESGAVLRVASEGGSIERLIRITEPGHFSALRFGNGVEGWVSDRLYVTNRDLLFALDVGIRGRAPVYPVP